jgi:predicted metal-binding protein
MNDTPAPDAASSLPSQRVRAGIQRGEKYACTIVRGSTVVCLRAGVAWCPMCEMPRCAEDSVGGCARCNMTTISFAAIKAGTA